jgi:Tol biopolymer transport system component
MNPRMSLRAGILAFSLTAPALAQNPIERVSVDSNGRQASQGNEERYSPGSPTSISADGRFVAFTSLSSDLVAGDTNGSIDVFVHDRTAGGTVRVSIDSSGQESNGDSYYPSISGDGRFVAFESEATNLVANDLNGLDDVFLHDRDPDGNGIFDEGNGVTARISVDANGRNANGWSAAPSISSDGSKVVFLSQATDLVANKTTNYTDVFVRDVAAGTTSLVSVALGGTSGNNYSSWATISPDAGSVAFISGASDLVPNDTNSTDCFVRDLVQGTTTRVSVDSSGAQGNGQCDSRPAISADGAIVVFDSSSTNLVPGDQNGRSDIFAHDLATGATVRLSVGPGGVEADWDCYFPAASGDGRCVAFRSAADDLVGGDTNLNNDVFLVDRDPDGNGLFDEGNDVVEGTSFNALGIVGDGWSDYPSLSGDGQLVAFTSSADNLVASDTNQSFDAFVRDRSQAPADASWSNYGAGYPGTLGTPTISASADPVLGTTISIDVSNSVGNWIVGILLGGVSRASIPTSAGGTLLVWPLALLQPFPIAPYGGSFLGDLPLDIDLLGVTFDLQAIEFDPGAAHGLSFTGGLELYFGV